MTITATVFQYALTELGTFLGTTYGGLMGAFAGPSRTITAIYVAVVGYMVLMGKAGEKTKDWALSLVLLPMLVGVIFEPGLYSEWIVEPFRDMALELGGLVGRAGSGDGLMSVFDRVDDAIGRTLHSVDEVDVPGNIFTEAWTIAKIFLAAAIITALFIFLYLAFVVLLIQAFFGMYAMFLAGGIAMFFAIFKETRFITWTWLRQLFNYALWAVFICMVMGIGVNGIEHSAAEMAAWDPAGEGVFTEAYGIALFWIALLIYALLKTGDYSAALTGGAAPQAGGLIGAGMMVTGGAMMGGARALHAAAGGWAGVGKLAGGVAGLGARGIRAWSKMRGIH